MICNLQFVAKSFEVIDASKDRLAHYHKPFPPTCSYFSFIAVVWAA